MEESLDDGVTDAAAAPAYYLFLYGRDETRGFVRSAWAAVVVTLVWLWLSGLALLIEAEMNAEAERSRELRQGAPAERELQAPAKA